VQCLISVVLGTGCPAQILSTVVPPDAVVVASLVPRRWTTNEREQYAAMDRQLLHNVADT
jgi:hypothetical protein